jgi:LAO/AO transport system kinase
MALLNPQELSREERAYVRPSPSKGWLGGITQFTDEVVLMCEAAG